MALKIRGDRLMENLRACDQAEEETHYTHGELVIPVTLRATWPECRKDASSDRGHTEQGAVRGFTKSHSIKFRYKTQQYTWGQGQRWGLG